MVQWLRLHASTTGVMGSISGQGTKTPNAKKKKKRIHTSNAGDVGSIPGWELYAHSQKVIFFLKNVTERADGQSIPAS